MRFLNGRGIGVLVVAAALGGCGTLLGLDEYKLQTCEDGEKGEGEADVDCGGICAAPCGAGQGCAAGKDCESLVCGASGRCEAASCADGVKNAEESDLDCGGSCGATCGPEKGCKANGDCLSGACEGAVCAPTCTDGVKSGDESDLDCGGSCGPTCGPEKACKANGDCVGGACEEGVCTPTCTDKVKSGDESDVDCGGPKCDACELGQGCATSVDCMSGVCHAEGCVAEHAWSMRFGDPQEQKALDLIIDTFGNVLVAGTIKGTVDFGGGPLTTPMNGSYFVTKRDSKGNHVWTKLFGDPSGQELVHIATDSSGNVFIGCSSTADVDFGGGFLGSIDESDIYIAKLDAEGNHVWSNVYGGFSYDRIHRIQVRSTDTILLSGDFYGTLSFGGGILSNSDTFGDVFVAELTNDGNHVWSKSYTSEASLPPVNMDLDTNGNIILAGSFFGSSVDFGGGPLTSAGNSDVFLAKLDPTGKHIWSKRFGSAANEFLLGMALDKSDNAIVTGHFNGSFDFGGKTLAYSGGVDAFVAKLGPTGNHLWSSAFGDAANQVSTDIAIGNSDKVLLGGSMSGTVDFGGGPLVSGDEDIFLVALTADGAHVWSRRFGGSDAQVIEAIATDDAGNVAVAGAFKGFLSFGGNPLVSAGLTDIYIAKLAYP